MTLKRLSTPNRVSLTKSGALVCGSAALNHSCVEKIRGQYKKTARVLLEYSRSKCSTYVKLYMYARDKKKTSQRLT